MTPALAFFYGGLVRRKNLVSTLVQCIIIFAVVSLIWFFWGYSLVYGPSIGGVIGNLSLVGLNGITINSRQPHRSSHSNNAILRLSTQIRSHHTSINHRRMRRKNQIQITPHLRCFVVNFHLFPNRVLDVEPKRMVTRFRRSRFCRRHSSTHCSRIISTRSGTCRWQKKKAAFTGKTNSKP